MTSLRIAHDVAWTPTSGDGYAIGKLPGGPLVVLHDSSALIWELATSAGREPFQIGDLAQAVLDTLQSGGVSADRAEVVSQTKTFAQELLARGLLELA